MRKKHHFFLFHSIIVLLFSGIVLFLCAKYFINQSIYLLVGLFVALFLLGALRSLPVAAASKCDRKFGSLLAGTSLYFIGLAILFLKRFSLERFPIDDPEMVIAGLTNINGAIDRGIYYDIFAALTYALGLTLVFFFLVLAQNFLFPGSSCNLHIINYFYHGLYLWCSYLKRYHHAQSHLGFSYVFF